MASASRLGKKRERPRPAAAPQPAAAAAAAAAPDGNLARASQLIVECKYSNELPKPPVPKLLRALPSAERLFRYRPTALELDHRPVMLSEKDVLSCVELVHPDAYGDRIPFGSMPPPPPPQDSILLNDADWGKAGDDDEAKRRRLTDTTDAFHREAFGLQLPQLITNDIFTERQRYTTGMEATEKKIERDPPGYKSVEDLVGRIEKTFEQAQKPPVHPTNPKLRAKRVMPIVPDAVLWSNRYRQVIFDELPREPRLNDILFKTTPTPRSTCFGFFAETEPGSLQFSLAENYLWDNRGGFTRAVDCSEGEAVLLSFPPDSDEAGEVRFVVAPQFIKLKKQKAHSLEINLETKSLGVTYRDPSSQEQLQERDRMAAVLTDEGDEQDQTSFAFVDGEWHIRGDPRQASSHELSHPSQPASQSGSVNDSHSRPGSVTGSGSRSREAGSGAGSEAPGSPVVSRSRTETSASPHREGGTASSPNKAPSAKSS